MFAKISLTAAFLLMVAPPIACASNRALANPAPVSYPAIDPTTGIVIAQDADSDAATSTDEKDSDKDSDSDNDGDNNADENQADNGQNDNNQMDQNQNDGGAAGAEGQSVPPTVLGQPDSSDDNDSGNTLQTPQNGVPMNPYQ
jgi:hypothetical protein